MASPVLFYIYLTREQSTGQPGFFRRANALKPTTPQIAEQIKQIERITRGCGDKKLKLRYKDLGDKIYNRLPTLFISDIVN